MKNLEERQMYRLIAFDMDGTLLDSKKEILESSIQAVKDAERVGKIVILNTGRGLAELQEYLPKLPKVRYLNALSGALVYDLKEEKEIYSQSIPVEIVKQLMAYASEEQAMPQILTDRSIIQKSHWEHMERYHMGIYQKMFETVAVKWDDIEKTYLQNPFPAAKFNIYHTSPESRARTKEKIQAAGIPVTMVCAETTSLEISALGVDKGVGLERLCQHIQLPLSETIVVGDAENDIGALKKAGLSVVMDNAAQNIKDLADVVVADCDHGGCAEAVKRYLLNLR